MKLSRWRLQTDDSGDTQKHLPLNGVEEDRTYMSLCNHLRGMDGLHALGSIQSWVVTLHYLEASRSLPTQHANAERNQTVVGCHTTWHSAFGSDWYRLNPGSVGGHHPRGIAAQMQ